MPAVRHLPRRVVLPGVLGLGLAGLAAAPALADTVTFAFTGAEQVFVVPPGVTSVHAVLVGAPGGRGAGNPDARVGMGARIEADIFVAPGERLLVRVGGAGQPGGVGSPGRGGSGGYNGGGTGGDSGDLAAGSGAGGGGGATDVRVPPADLQSRMLTAAGGGGDGGGPAGGRGGSGWDPVNGATGGGLAGGTGGPGATPTTPGGTGPLAGMLGFGGFGQGGSVGVVTGGGGGGGGGYYGGAGGVTGSGGGSSGGGGGAGSWRRSSNVSGPNPTADTTGVPLAQITFTPPPATTQGGGSGTGSGGSGAPGSGGTGSGVTGPAGPGTTPNSATSGRPNTILTAGPEKIVVTRRSRARVTFSFAATVKRSRFRCKLDDGEYASCRSPLTLRVRPGRHKLSIKASRNGLTDRTPAVVRFRVVRSQD